MDGGVRTFAAGATQSPARHGNVTSCFPVFASVADRIVSPVGRTCPAAAATGGTPSPSIRRTSDIMKTVRIALAGVAAFAAISPLAALAQSSAGVSTTGSARIVQPIAITKNSDLAFGTVVRPTSGSNTVTIDQTAGTRSLSGGGDAVLVTSTTSRASYTVGGEGGQTFSITVPATFSMTGSTSGTITVNLTPTATTGTLSGAVGAAGSATFGVGGDFTLPSTQATGNYSGSFTATVAYN